MAIVYQIWLLVRAAWLGTLQAFSAMLRRLEVFKSLLPTLTGSSA